jgi:hypothetical protein
LDRLRPASWRSHFGALIQQPCLSSIPAAAIPEWKEENAVAALGIQRVRFEDLDGNTQG